VNRGTKGIERIGSLEVDGNAHVRGNLEVGGTLTQDGGPVGGSPALETPTGAVNGNNAAFVFTAPPVLVFRNGVMEFRLGSVSINTFTFDTAPESGDDIEGLV
jgi:hypothetical protein